jgi:hypothetical protein
MPRFTLAFITALVRLRERYLDMPYGSVFLVEQMTKADEMYRELSALLPGKVAVWSTDHDLHCKSPTKVQSPAARFHVSDLENYEVAIVTHAFYKGRRGDKARNVLDDNGATVPRALTIIDEQSDDISIFDVTLSGATDVLEAVQQDERSGAAVVPYVHALIKFMTKKALGGSLEKPSDDPAAWAGAASALEWFTTTAARENALAIARADQSRHVERAHLSACFVSQPIQKRLEPMSKLASPIRRPANHGRPLQKADHP